MSLSGRIVVDTAIGQVTAGQPLTTQTLLPWLSSGKPLTAVAVARQWQAGRLDLDDPVAKFIPEFANKGKGGVTVRHLLTHSSGLRHVVTGWPDVSWDKTIELLCQADLEADWRPSQSAGYHVASSWFLLGEIVARVTGQDFAHHVRESICRPAGLDDVRLAFTPEELQQTADRRGVMYVRQEGELAPQPWNLPDRLTRPSPGGSTWGRAGELRHFYEHLLAGARAGGSDLLTAQTVSAMTARHRVGRHDATFQQVVDFGLGFIIDSKQYAAASVPYGYGPHCSPRTFGHGGAQSSIGFADPEYALAVAVIYNGMPGEGQHNRRNWQINTAIYEDLGLANATNSPA